MDKKWWNYKSGVLIKYRGSRTRTMVKLSKLSCCQNSILDIWKEMEEVSFTKNIYKFGPGNKWTLNYPYISESLRICFDLEEC